MPNSACAPPGCEAEAGDHLVEDHAGARSSAVMARTSLQELLRLEVGPAALHRLDQHGRQLVGVLADELERFGRAVVQHAHVAEHAAHHAGRGRHALGAAAGAHQHLVEGAVVRAAEQHDGAAAGVGARDADAPPSRPRSRCCTAPTRSKPVSSQRQLRRPRRRAGAAGRSRSRGRAACGSRRSRKSGVPAEQVHAEAVERVDVFVAVNVPHARALGAVDHQLVGDLLGRRAEAVDHARVGHVRAVGGGEFLALAACARHSAARRRSSRACWRGGDLALRVWMRAMAPKAFLTS